MKQTRRQQIRQKIFKLDDLKRIASVFDEQARLAKKSDHHHTVEYTVHFADDTSFESDTPAILDDPAVEIRRPVKVEFDFNNYRSNRRISFSVTHGSSEYGNEFLIRADEDKWLNDVFMRLEEFIGGAETQSFWFAKHPAVLMNLIALGLGSLIYLVLDVLVYAFAFFVIHAPLEISLSESTGEKLQALRAFLDNGKFLLYLGGWLWKWICGWVWGAIPLTNWLLGAWPNIDLDFGADHLKIEKKKRERIKVALTMIIIPVVLAIVQDLIEKII
jgi:hypothetical protein